MVRVAIDKRLSRSSNPLHRVFGRYVNRFKHHVRGIEPVQNTFWTGSPGILFGVLSRSAARYALPWKRCALSRNVCTIPEITVKLVNAAARKRGNLKVRSFLTDKKPIIYDQVLPLSYYAFYLVVDISLRNTKMPWGISTASTVYVTWNLVYPFIHNNNKSTYYLKTYPYTMILIQSCKKDTWRMVIEWRWGSDERVAESWSLHKVNKTQVWVFDTHIVFERTTKLRHERSYPALELHQLAAKHHLCTALYRVY